MLSVWLWVGSRVRKFGRVHQGGQWGTVEWGGGLGREDHEFMLARVKLRCS